MNTFRKLLRRWFTTARVVVYECRNCGTNLDEQQHTCPACGSDETSQYDLE